MIMDLSYPCASINMEVEIKMKIHEMTLTSNWLVKECTAERQYNQKKVVKMPGNESYIKVSISEESQNAYRNSLNNLEGYTPSSLKDYLSLDEQGDLWASGKFDMDVSYSLYIEMKQLERGRIESIKDKERSYDLFDVAQSTLEAYGIMYDKIVQGHKDGTREVYTNFPEEGKPRYVTLEDDLEFLNKAFDLCMENVKGYICAKETSSWDSWIKGTSILPQKYKDQVYNMMKEVKEELQKRFEEKYENWESYAGSVEISSGVNDLMKSIFMRDNGFVESIKNLFLDVKAR
ncbi:hypothetical protein R2R35_05595 [Anaerocolumna sp. AGMB13020]|uniref:hypothetical protein n=1 Tax=Anaerocolumna sp. AGMB13020 TaxID=3081750 RepID=UPI002955DF5B|nr:hypothetical protein [Anaerocolumna sp. AGMB13020]WOO37977.1 hypothetical protein R2R35_05595 [Anaerocolumna sp. AGMB13020]